MLDPTEARFKSEVVLNSMRWPLYTEVTCESCPINDTCDLAFDPYNTDGDCLAEK